MDFLHDQTLLIGGGIVFLILFSATLFFIFRKKSSSVELPPSATPSFSPEKPVEEVVEVTETVATKTVEKEKVAEEVVEKKEISLSEGISRSKAGFWGKLGKLLQGQSFGESELESIEEILYTADLGPKLVMELMDYLKQHLKTSDVEAMKKILWDFLWAKLSPIQATLSPDILEWKKKDKVSVLFIAGINGAGKTTTVGKLATKFSQAGASVYVGACDTFRAAAVDQLQVWCDRAKAKMVRAKEGGDPSGVAYQTFEESTNNQADICLIDTAGRLHTNNNLMEELKKIQRVLGKLDATAPHRVILVLDAITGQNAVRQAQEFHKTLGVTELILTKCDGSSKAGSVIGIMQELKIPVSYIGIGENVEDLRPFSLEEYLSAVLDYRP